MQRQLGDSQIKQEKMSVEIFYEKVAKGLLANAVQKIQALGQANRPASRLVRREQFIYRIPVTHVRLEGESQCACSVCVCAERSKCHIGKTVKKSTTIYNRKCDAGLCIGQCFEVCHSKLNYWKEKWQLIFTGSATKTLYLCNV
jgi:hypothetical protein